MSNEKDLKKLLYCFSFCMHFILYKTYYYFSIYPQSTKQFGYSMNENFQNLNPKLEVGLLKYLHSQNIPNCTSYASFMLMILIVFKRANVFECSHALHVHKTTEQSIFVNLCMYIFSKYITDIDTCSLLTVVLDHPTQKLNEFYLQNIKLDQTET